MNDQENVSLVRGPKTHELAGLIPAANLEAYLAIYFALCSIEVRPYLDHNPRVELEGIRKYLQKLKKHGFVTADTSRQILGMLFRSIMETTAGREALAALAMKKEGPSENRPFNFLVFALVQDAIHYTKKPRYALIGDFLNEQQLGHHTACFNYMDIAKRYKRLSLDRIIQYVKGYLVADGNLTWMKGLLSSKTDSLQEGDFLTVLISSIRMLASP